MQFFLVSPVVQLNAIQFIQGIRADSECQLMVEIREKTRNDEQNKRFHAMCGDVSAQLTYMGKKISPAAWKVLFISGHAIATGEGAEIVPGLEGEFCNIRESSAKMSVKRMASSVSYTHLTLPTNGW
jgi:hypothetical protein